MSFDAIQEEIQFTGGLLTISVFEEKLMKNFLIISNKLRKLDVIAQLQQKNKHIEKQLKFLTMKVETIVEKLPRDGGSISKNDVKNIAKEQIIDVLNANDQKLLQSKFSQDINTQIQKIKEEMSYLGTAGINLRKESGGANINTAKASFTAAQILKEGEKTKKISKQSMQDVLDENEMKIMNTIIEGQSPEKQRKQASPIDEVNEKIDDIYKKLDQLRLGKGFSHYAEKEAEKFEKYQQYEEKSRQTNRKNKEKPLQLEGVKTANVKGQILKNQLYSEVQRAELMKEEIAKQELLQRKSLIANGPHTKNPLLSLTHGEFKRTGGESERRKDNNNQNKVDISGEDMMKRARSIKKLDKLDRRLKVDDIKDINSVLREIQLRIQGKVSHEIFMGFIKDFEEKLEIIRLTNNPTVKHFFIENDLGQFRKNIYVIENKLQSIINYLQSISNDEDALLVKKQWTCISCDKNLEKYNGKVGQHLNWDAVNSKKISPSKVGAFGQTGQLATKIKNLMDLQEE